MPHHYWLSLTLLFIIFIGGCEQKRETSLEPLPEIIWDAPPVTPFLPQDTWENAKADWGMLNDTLRFSFDLPEALETKLTREDREIWRDALKNMEQSQLERKDAAVISKLQISSPVQCEVPGSVLSLQQRAQLQLTLQLHRNVLWRIGRLEMASRGVSSAIKNFLPQFSGGRIKDADQFIAEPITSMVTQIKQLREDQPIPKGIWMPGEFQYRMARTAQAAPIILEALESLKDWNQRIQASERWNYLAESPKPLIENLEIWVEEYEKLYSF